MSEPFPFSASSAEAQQLTIYGLRDEIVNQNEASVLRLVDSLQQKGSLPCTCRDCLLDIAAIALNSLGAHYTVSLHQELYVTPEQVRERQNQVQAAVDMACQKVRERPHH